ncbi:MAG: hypothetical protein KAX49_17445, partial [Halanaerobiales bacterium]|nr:hypothetical protein [Halanaerobiales bacterium]
MFIEIKYNQVKQNPVKNFVQHKVNTYKNELTNDVGINYLETIIHNNMNIQVALSYQYYFQREFDSEVVSPITLSGNLPIEDAINDLAIIFRRVVVPYDVNGTPYIIQLEGINKLAKKAFHNMILTGKVNPILSYFSIERSYIEDCNKTSFYKYFISDELTKQKENDYSLFCNNMYIRHILLKNKHFTCSSFINVSGFSVEELNKSPYVYYLNSLVSDWTVKSSL